jgi:hypothetical protein
MNDDIIRHYNRAAAVVAAHQRFINGHSKAVDSMNKKARLRVERAITREVKAQDELRSRSMNDILEQFEGKSGPKVHYILDPENPMYERIMKAARALNSSK